MKKQHIFTLFSLIVSVSILYFLFSTISISDVFRLILNVDRNALLAFVLLSLAMSFFRTWRYALLLALSSYYPNRLALFLVVLVRNFFADLLPARIGTAIYVYIVNQRLGVPFGAAASSFALSFLFDIIAMAPLLIFAAAAAAGSEVPSDVLVLGAVVLAVITLGILFSLPYLLGLSVRIISGIKNIAWLEKIAKGLAAARAELLKAHKAGVYFDVMILSMLVRITKYAALYIFLYALMKPLGYSFADLDFAKVFLGICSSELAASLPISGIAGFGAYEGAWAFTFSLMGYPMDIAKLTAISHHLFTQFYGYSLGALALGVLMLPFFKWQAREMVADNNKASLWNNFYLRCASSSALFYVLILLSFSLPLSGPQEVRSEGKVDRPDQTELSAAKSLKDEMDVAILFDSNRSGNFGIYKMNFDGSNLKAIVDSDWHEMYPDPSPDGKKIVYARTRSTLRFAPSEVWVADHDGSNPKRLANKATFPTFSADGKTVYFERERRKLMAVDIESGDIRKLFPFRGSGFGSFQVVKPRVSADGRFVAFTSDKGGRWNAWYADLESGAAQHIKQGCEPTWFPDMSSLAFIKKSGAAAVSGVYGFNRTDKSVKPVQDDGPPWGHEYFPTYSSDGEFLLYSACPADQHDHLKANYQIFIRDLKGETPLRLSYSSSTDRWPKFMRLAPSQFEPKKFS